MYFVLMCILYAYARVETWILFCFLYALQQFFLGEKLDQFKPSYVVQGVTAGALCFEVRIFSR
jgi:hypothetical protein